MEIGSRPAPNAPDGNGSRPTHGSRPVLKAADRNSSRITHLFETELFGSADVFVNRSNISIILSPECILFLTNNFFII